MKEFHLCGLGNAILDIFLEMSDAECTLGTCLAVSSRLAARHVDEERIAKSRWLFVEGYLFANPDNGQGAIREAIRLAKKHGTKIAVTCSEAFVVNAFGDAFFE